MKPPVLVVVVVVINRGVEPGLLNYIWHQFERPRPRVRRNHWAVVFNSCSGDVIVLSCVVTYSNPSQSFPQF